MKHKKSDCFFRPDYTVGEGISPFSGPQKTGFADYTAGEDFRLAPKNSIYVYII